MKQVEYVNSLEIKTTNDKAAEFIAMLKNIENDLFLGKEEIQPIKFHQIGRIYRLAKSLIEIIVFIWPFIKVIVKWIK